ncbi:AAA family ATPase [Terrabacter sp. NPDC080008]|uniref:AAA family ATPase n=1 Tax=Terrabacter sp. NPDC080008 TaxID=3155176 RepID=UPI003450A8FA
MTTASGAVVTPKHRRPAVTARTVRRAALPAPRALATAVERDAGTVVLVAGSAGTGKTTLLATWARDLESRGDAVGWASLDRDDDEPSVLAQSIAEAIRGALATGPDRRPTSPDGADESDANDGDSGGSESNDGGARVPTLDGAAKPRVLVDEVVRVAASRDRQLWLLLDDAHVVRSATSRALLDRLIRWAPANLHLVMATRSEPDLHLARLRVEERLVELREPELRFSLDEAGELLRLHGLSLDAGDVDRLHQLAEGWPAGLGLAAMSLSRGRDTDTFLQEFAHNDRAISSYLVEEVLSTLEPDAREFLVTTSVLDRVDPDAAAALTGRPDARAMLLELSADSAMVTAVPTGTAAPDTFRYHSLLRSHLAALLASQGSGRLRRAHRAAARWYLASGRPRQALHHAREAGDDALASEVIRRQALHLLTEGQADEVRRTVAELATEDPLVTGMAALALGELADPQAAREALDRLSERMPEARGAVALGRAAGGGSPPLQDLVSLGGRMLALISRPAEPQGSSRARTAAPRTTSVRSLVGRAHHASVAAVPSGRFGPSGPPGSGRSRLSGSASPGPSGHAGANGFAPEAGHGVGHGVANGVGHVARSDAWEHHALDFSLLAGLTDGGELLAAGRFDEASRAFRDVLETARRTGHELVALQAMSGLASVCAGAEDFQGVDLWSGRALRMAEGTPWQRSPRLLPAYVLAAWSAYHRMDDDAARRRNDVARTLLAESASPVDGGPGPDEGSPRQRGLAQLGRMSRLLDAHLALAVDRSPSSTYAVARSVRADVRAIATQSLTEGMAANEVVSIHELLLRAGCARMAPEVEDVAAHLGIDPLRLCVMTALRLLHEGDDDAAREIVHDVLAEPDAASWRDVVKAELMAAVLASRRGQPWRSHELLVAAMERAAPEGAVRLVVDTVPGVPDLLLADAGRFGPLERFASDLLEHVAEARPVPASRREGRLTARELSLLRELPSLLTIKEIAAARSVSANTVKTQLRSIFDKLGVSSRREAVAAGRRLGLL